MPPRVRITCLHRSLNASLQLLVILEITITKEKITLPHVSRIFTIEVRVIWMLIKVNARATMSPIAPGTIQDTVAREVQTPKNSMGQQPVVHTLTRSINCPVLPQSTTSPLLTGSKNGVLTHTLSKCGSNSKLVQSPCNNESPYTTIEKTSGNQSSVNGMILGHTPQHTVPNNKGSNACQVQDRHSVHHIKSMDINPINFDIPSFDLGMDLDINIGGVDLDDGIVLSEVYLAQFEYLKTSQKNR